MSPQPAAAPPRTEPQTGGAADYIGRKIEQAKQLERERAKLFDRIAANRRQLRDMATSGDLNAEQTKWVRTFYPEKEKDTHRSKEEVEATRKAREAARKDGTTNGGSTS